MKLYEITEQHKGFLSLIENEEIPEEAIKDTFEAIQGDFESKAISLVSVTKNIQVDVDAIDNEIKRLQTKKKTIANRVDKLREYLRINMEQTGINKIACPFFSVTLSSGQDVVEIDDLDQVPEDYKKVTVAPDKVLIKKALKDGCDVSGAKLSKGKSRLTIR